MSPSSDDQVAWPALLVDDGGWIDYLRGPQDFTVEPTYADEVVAVSDRRGRRFRAVEADDEVRLVAASQEPEVDALVAHLDAATTRWLPHLEPLDDGASLAAAFHRARLFDRRTQRLRRLWARARARFRDRVIPRGESRRALEDLHEAVLGPAAGDVEDLLARYEQLAGLDVAVQAGVDDRAVRTWGVAAFLITGRGFREHCEPLAFRRPGERSWTVDQSAESARAGSEQVVERWAAGLTDPEDPR